MGKLRSAALILGEGPTEFYYFKSLSGMQNSFLQNVKDCIRISNAMVDHWNLQLPMRRSQWMRN